jgi:hypothetical protein
MLAPDVLTETVYTSLGLSKVTMVPSPRILPKKSKCNHQTTRYEVEVQNLGSFSYCRCHTGTAPAGAVPMVGNLLETMRWT